ncbi:MAG: hypothetical protein R3D33_01225 [Hyphomicrobiaceae bacterium]
MARLGARTPAPGAGPADNRAMMVCEHLKTLEAELLASGVREVHRGAVWSRNCREWVYFDCPLDLPALRARLAFAPCVIDHVHRGTHDGSEAGFVCTLCNDAIMGVHPDHAAGRRHWSGFRSIGTKNPL